MSDDQDTTAPGRVALMYPLGCEKSVLWARPEHYSSVHPSMRQWAPCIARCIWDAALEELRVRAALKRAGMDENGMVHVGLNWWNEK